MRYTQYLWLAALAVCGASLSHATITLTFSAPGSSADGFRDQDGNIQNGMEWGVIVLTDSSVSLASFEDILSNLSPFDINTSNYLDAEETLWYTFGSGSSTGSTRPVTQTHFGNVGSVVSQNNIDYTNLAAGYKFAIIWFPDHEAALGSPYGYLTDADFILPADGGTSNPALYSLPVFSGVGNFVATERIGGDNIPEPSTYAALLSGAVLVAVGIRRRMSRR